MAGIWLAMTAQGQQTQAERLIQAGHWKRARVIVETRFHEAPDDPLAYFLLSQIRYAFGDRKAPLQLAEEAVALKRGVAKYHRQLAEALGIEAQHAGTIRQLLLAGRFRKEIDAALALDPRDVQALRDLMEFYLVAPRVAGGAAEKAETIADRIRTIDAPEGLLAEARIAAFHKQNAAQEALLRQAAQAQPASYRARIELGEFELGNPHAGLDVAEAAANDALNLDASRVESYAILAAIYAIRADWRALDAILSDAEHAVPDDLTPYYRAADRLLTAGRDPARAERYLRTYLTEEPDGNEASAAEARRKLAMAQAAEKRVGGAFAEENDSHGPAKHAGVQ